MAGSPTVDRRRQCTTQEDLAAQLRRRAAVCEEFQNGPKDARVDAVAEEKKDFGFLKGTTHEEDEDMAGSPTVDRRRQCTTQEDLAAQLRRRAAVCEEFQNGPKDARVDAVAE